MEKKKQKRSARYYYRDEEIKFLKDNVSGVSNKELADKFNKKFNLNQSPAAIQRVKFKYGLHSFTAGWHRYSDEEIKFLEDNVEEISVKELTDKFNKKFNLNQSLLSIHAIKFRHELYNKIKGGFKKGNDPWNAKEIMCERITAGYVYIKVKDPDEWVLKHRYIYEQKYGKIPKGCNVIFADGDKTNFNLDNLILVKNELNGIMAKKRLYFSNAELTKTGINIAKMLLKLEKIKKV
jgi:hypothetical protein